MHTMKTNDEHQVPYIVYRDEVDNIILQHTPSRMVERLTEQQTRLLADKLLHEL